MTEQHVRNRTMPPSTVIPQLIYEDVGEAIRWLCDKFDFVERWHAGDHRAQLSFGGGTVVVTEPRTSSVLPGRQSVLVRVEDVDAHCARARDRGARILTEPQDHPYGERQYTAEDLGGHHWNFSQSIADVVPEAWGGTSEPGMGPWATPVHGAFADGRPLVSVMLIVPGAAAAVDWYAKALGARVLWDLSGVAGLEIDGAPFFLHEINTDNPAETSPEALGGTSTRIELFVDEPEAFVDRALTAGATLRSPVVAHEVPWGEHRQGGFQDPFGHQW